VGIDFGGNLGMVAGQFKIALVFCGEGQKNMRVGPVDIVAGFFEHFVEHGFAFFDSTEVDQDGAACPARGHGVGGCQ